MRDLAPVIALTSGSALVRLRVDAGTRVAVVSIECLRRAATGESLVDTPVELRLAGLRALALKVPSAPSDGDDAALLENHEELVFDRVDVEVALIGKDAVEEALTDARCKWRVGSLESSLEAAHRLSVSTHTSDPTQLFTAFDALLIESGGIELSVDAWARQHAAWWHGWEERWQSRPPGSRG